MKTFLTKTLYIFLNMLPIIAMIAFIPLVSNDVSLSLLFVGIIMFAFIIKRQKYDMTIFFFGFFVMLLCEYLFIKTGVEFFIRNSLFGIMPLWLPILWAYGFVAIKRAVLIIKK